MVIRCESSFDSIWLVVYKRLGKGKLIEVARHLISKSPTQEEKDSAADFLVSQGAADKYRQFLQKQGESI